MWLCASEYLQNQAAGQAWLVGCRLPASASGMSLSFLDLGIFPDGPVVMRRYKWGVDRLWEATVLQIGSKETLGCIHCYGALPCFGDRGF